MKIGLISPYNSQNYGTVLQAFALAHVLRQKGVDCEYINYSTWERGNKIEYLLFLLHHPLFLLSRKRTQYLNRNDLKYSHVRSPWFAEVVRKNNEFVEKNIPVSSRTYTYDTLNELSKEYDKFIVGSDQTWSPFHELFYSMFFLDYYKYGKSYSYAPSLGTTSPSKWFVKYLAGKIVKMRLASCREECNCGILSKASGKKVTCVLDPTLLLSHNTWQTYFTIVNNMPKDYILCYILGERKDISEFAEKLGKEKYMPIYYITTREVYRQKEHTLDNIGVKQFLWLISNARYVVTDSFHCCIFSINFNKEFYCFDKMAGDSYDNGRLSDVLNQFGLSDRLVNNNGVTSAINYVTVNNTLLSKRNQSLSFIDRIIGD